VTLGISKEQALGWFEQMLLIRRFEERCAELYSAGKIRGFLHLYIGEEAIAVGAVGALDPEDNLIAAYREHGQALVRGVDPGAVMAEMFGKENGCARGHGGSMHLFDAKRRFFGGHAIVAGGLPVAVGLALADKLSGRAGITVCFFGDGASEEGEFAESLNLAALWKLPILFVCENNQYAMGTALARHAANTDLSARALAYGIGAERADGMDVLAVARAVHYARELVQELRAPRFLELTSYRFRAHSMYDPDKYRTKEEIARWKTRDPIALFEARLVAEKLLEPSERDAAEQRVARVIGEAVAEAEHGALEPESELERGVYERPEP
jgi:pyruvate dehydrogenase E1 component alpha subunit